MTQIHHISGIRPLTAAEQAALNLPKPVKPVFVGVLANQPLLTVAEQAALKAKA